MDTVFHACLQNLRLRGWNIEFSDSIVYLIGLPTHDLAYLTRAALLLLQASECTAVQLVCDEAVDALIDLGWCIQMGGVYELKSRN